MLLFVFGCVAVVYAAYWASRALSATKEAAIIFKESGSLTETVRRLYAHETTPDAIRMSSNQRDYVSRNLAEFMEIHRPAIENTVAKIIADLEHSKAAAGAPLAEVDLVELQRLTLTTVAMKYAKGWCELRGIA
jgi:hypothetical protein